MFCGALLSSALAIEPLIAKRHKQPKLKIIFFIFNSFFQLDFLKLNLYLNVTNYKENDRYYQQHMNRATGCVRRHQTQQPQNQQNNRNGKKHV
jgi:hypothetical protein